MKKVFQSKRCFEKTVFSATLGGASFFKHFFWLFMLSLSLLFCGVFLTACKSDAQNPTKPSASVLVTLDGNGGTFFNHTNGWSTGTGSVSWLGDPQLKKTTNNYNDTPTPTWDGYDFLGWQQPLAISDSKTFTSWGYQTDGSSFMTNEAIKGNLLPSATYRVKYDISFSYSTSYGNVSNTGQWGLMGLVQNGSSFYSLGTALGSRVTNSNAGSTTFHVDTYLSTPSSLDNTWIVIYTGLTSSGNFISATVSNFSMFLEEHAGRTARGWASTYDYKGLWLMINNGNYVTEYDVVINESDSGSQWLSASSANYSSQWGDIGFQYGSAYCASQDSPLYTVGGTSFKKGHNYHIVAGNLTVPSTDPDRVTWYSIQKDNYTSESDKVANATIKNLKFYYVPSSQGSNHEMPWGHYLLARWKPRKVEVTLQESGQEFYYQYTDPYGYGAQKAYNSQTDAFTKINIPTKEHYTFDGYYWNGNVIVDYEGYFHYTNLETLFDENYQDITLTATWTPNTYTLSFSNGYYYSSSGYSVSLSAPGCSISNSTLSSSNPTSTVSHTYSTTPITITLTRNDATLWLYIDGTSVSVADNSISWNWSPTASHSATWYIRELLDVKSNTSEGIASATYSKNSGSPGGGSTPSNATSMVIKQGTVVDFRATLKSGYNFDGWYNGSTKVSGDLTYSGVTISNNLTLTAKARRIYNRLYYNSTDKYFYFTDGIYPQRMVDSATADSLTSLLSQNKLTTCFEVTIAGQKCTIYDYGAFYMRIKSPRAQTLKLKIFNISSEVWEAKNITFNTTDYYWFECTSINWRVSDYGVSIDYYSDVLYDRFEADGGVIYGVSDLVLDYGKFNANVGASAGWKYESSDIHIALSGNYSSLSDEFFSVATVNRSFDMINDGTTNSKIKDYSKSVTGFVQASVEDIDKIFQSDNYATATNGKEYNVHNSALDSGVRSSRASDLVCMFLGIDYDDNATYTTRDLYDKNNSFRILPHGAKNNRFFNNVCGVRLAYAINGK